MLMSDKITTTLCRCWFLKLSIICNVLISTVNKGFIFALAYLDSVSLQSYNQLDKVFSGVLNYCKSRVRYTKQKTKTKEELSRVLYFKYCIPKELTSDT